MSTSQHPIASAFNAASTAAEVAQGLNLAGKVAVVTGGYAGIGLETTRVLRAAGARVVVPVRDPAKAAAALAGLDGVQMEPLDLLDPDSIRAFAERFNATGQPLHLLINSAGIMANPLTRDARGYESQLATNHLGHFQLTAQLWPALRRAGGARVVAVSSWGHRFSPVLFDDPNFERQPYDRWVAYGQSKTANILFARTLDERGQAHGVRAFSLHPGRILGTDLKRYLTTEDLRTMGVVDEAGNEVVAPDQQLKTIEQGAATSVWCATSPLLDDLGGVYCENCNVAPLAQDAANWASSGGAYQGVLPHALDPEAANRLWTLSEQLTGTAFL